ncbi:hypothetical protein [Lutibacter sp.]
MKTSNSIPTTKNPLDTWSYSPLQWNLYVKIAKKQKLEDNFYFGVGILILGIPGLMLLKGTSFLLSSVIVIPLALLLPLLRIIFGSPHLKTKQSKATIKIYPNYLDINGRIIYLITKNKWLKNVQIININYSLLLLEFNIAWQTRKGVTNDETRIPIPPDKINEAKKIIAYYNAF